MAGLEGRNEDGIVNMRRTGGVGKKEDCNRDGSGGGWEGMRREQERKDIEGGETLRR